jgi:cell division transport system permease protein
MNFVNIRRALVLASVNFWRNKWISLASILILSLTLIIVAVSLIQNIDISKTINSIKEHLDMTVYFDDSVPESDILDVKLNLQSRSDIRSVQYISKEDALKVFQNRPASQQVKDLVTTENNPLPRSLEIKTDTPESLEKIATFLNAPVYKTKIRRISYLDNKQIIQDLISKNNEVRRKGFFSSLTFVIISLIVIVNSIRTILSARKEEMEIMRLVGASDFFIKVPLLFEALYIAFIASIISTLFLILGLVFNLPIIPVYISGFFSASSTSIRDLVVGNIVLIFFSQFLLAFLLTAITSLFSLRRYLKI